MDVVVFLQTIEHIHEPDRLLERIARIAPVAYISTPNRLTLAAAGSRRSPTTPGTCASTTRPSTARCSPPTSTGSSCSASSTPAGCAPTSSRSAWAGTAIHPAARLTKPFYDRFIPAISSSDFKLSAKNLERALDFVGVCER